MEAPFNAARVGMNRATCSVPRDSATAWIFRPARMEMTGLPRAASFTSAAKAAKSCGLMDRTDRSLPCRTSAAEAATEIPRSRFAASRRSCFASWTRSDR